MITCHSQNSRRIISEEKEKMENNYIAIYIKTNDNNHENIYEEYENLIDNNVYRDNNTFNKDTIISLFFNHYSIDHLPDNASNVVERIFKIKDIVARYIWYLLIGLYSLSVSNFQLSRVRC